MGKKTPLKSKTPKALKITRNGDKFTFSWTNGETYKDVDLLIKINGKPKGGIPYKAGAKDLKNNKVTIATPYTWTHKDKKGKKVKTKYTPKTSVSFTVRGIRKASLSSSEKKKHDKIVESSYASWQTYAIELPSNPSVTVSWNGDEAQNSSTFTINVANADKANTKWFLNYNWRSIGQFEGGDPTNPGWTVAKAGVATGTHVIEESNLGGKAFKRTVQAYSSGKRGSGTKSAKSGKDASKIANSASHIYSIPNEPTDVSITSASEGADGINVSVTWKHNANGWHPIDKSECQYAISSPAAGMSAPKNLDGTSITTHTHYGSKQTTAWTDGDSHEIDKGLEPNQCLFVRIKFLHDAEQNYSSWVRATQLTSILSNPTDFSLESSPLGNTLRVNATNSAEDAVDDSFLVVYYKSSQGDGVFTDTKIIGIMPHGGYNYIYVKLPSDPLNPPEIEKIGVQAIAYHFKDSDFKPINVTSNTEFELLKDDLYYKVGDTYVKVTSEGFDSETEYYAYFNISVGKAGEYDYKEYELPILDSANSMRSAELWQDGNFPKPPIGFDVASISSTTAKASWQWSWAGATNIELSWADSSDAWESTAEPTIYRVSVYRATSWYIKGLDSGEVWYIRARFVGVNPDGTETIGPWSETKSLNLTAPPMAPELVLSANVATENQDIIASWVYTSNDGTPQEKAEIFLVTTDAYGERRGYYRPAVEKLLTDPDTGMPVFDDTLTYYTFDIEYTKVTNPISENLDSYYIFDDTTPILSTESGSTAQQLTFTPSEMHLSLGKIYYLSLRLTAKSSAISEWSKPVSLEVVEPLEPPIISMSAQFVPETVEDVVLGDAYTHTSDSALVADKSYYLVTGTEAEELSEDDLDLYYEKTNDIYVKTQDTVIVEGKTYYVIEADRVIEPVLEDIDLYYERNSTTEVRTYLALKSLPIILNVSGAGENGTTIISIERSGNFFTDKPDDSIGHGYDGEIVALMRVIGEEEITITQNDLIGYLDDNANYRLVVTIIDQNGQTATEEYMRASVTAESFDDVKSILFIRSEEKPYTYMSVEAEEFDPNAVYYYKNIFTVSWSHQPVIPTATVQVDPVRLASKITSGIPEGYTPAEGDSIDIYRLSVDNPQLIVSDGIIGETYVDPYPAIGEFGGHRVVYKTFNGDYITEDNTFSWIDLGADEDDVVNTPNTIINFEGHSVEVLYNIELSNSWKKDFKETKYLGGHIQGDWTPGVSRTSSIGTVSVITQDQETIKNLRRLADFAGIAHVRTRDGSSYAANVDVSENMSYSSFELANYSLSITRIDSESLDGMTLDEWNRLIAMQDESGEG